MVKSRAPVCIDCVLVTEFEGRKPPGSIFTDRSPDRRADLLAIERRRGQATVECGRQRLKIAIALEDECRTVILVGSCLADDINDAGPGAAHLGGEPSRRDLKLLHRVFREIRQRSADHLVVVVATIHGNIAALAKAARGAHFESVGLGRIEGRSRPVPGYQVGQLQEVSAIQRNALDGFGSDLLPGSWTG